MSVRRSLALSFAQRYVATVITFIATLILARLLSPAQIGIFSLCAAFVAIASVVRDFGVSEYLIQERNLDTQKIRGYGGIEGTYCAEVSHAPHRKLIDSFGMRRGV
jgi:O-antigen/teichoic acid export membrane protein